MAKQTGFPVILLAAAVAVAAAGCVAADYFRQPPPPLAEEFQQLVGGLGLGPDLHMAECALTFDPRLSVDCSHRAGPVLVGDEILCSRHSFTVWPLRRP